MKTGIRVIDAMTRSPITINPEASVIECARIMKKNKIGSLLVVDNEQNLVGIVTKSDLIKRVIANNLDYSIKVKEVMTKRIFTISPEKDLYEAIKKMKELDIRHLPVIDEKGKLIGLITLKDILKLQPHLFDTILDVIKLREETEKLKLLKPGHCEICGEYSEKLYRLPDGTFVCEKCKELY